MEVANSWADEEELAHNESPRAHGDDDKYANDNNRRYNHDAGQRRKRKGRGYDEMETTKMVAAEFPASRGNDYRKQGREQAREPARDQGRDRGRDQGREWQPKKIRTGLPCQSSSNSRPPAPTICFITTTASADQATNLKIAAGSSYSRKLR